MVYRRERPKCRKVIERLLRERNCGLEELLQQPRHRLSAGLRIQARKMLDEQKEAQSSSSGHCRAGGKMR